ncbi:MAG: LysE family translocator [Actinobacteria bacterium]|nr:LysE family translocator [Actinomycetota bacterium]
MPTSSSLFAFAALSFALIAVPGPSVMFIVSRGVALGRRAALLTVVGNTAGIFAQVLLVAVGVGAVVERSAAAFTALKLAGAAYLVMLGLRAVRHRAHLASAAQNPNPSQDSATATRAVLVEGFVVGLANPKAIVFLAAILPQFVSSNGSPAALQMAVLGLVFVAIALALDSVWAMASGSARHWFVTQPNRLSQLSGLGGLTMIALGIGLAASGSRN